MIIFKLAWRNLWRNSKRSWISILAISTAFLILMVISGILDGLSLQMLKNGTELFQGHIQVHHQDYLPGRNMYDWIGYREPYDLEALLSTLDSVEGIEASAPRVYGFALISTGENTRATNLSGMDPVRESSVTRLFQSPIAGRNLAPDPRGEILVGRVLAKIMKVSPGDEVAIVTQAADGTTGNDLYTVSGVISTGLTSLDRSLVVMHWRDLQELLAMEEWQVHEAALRVGKSPGIIPDCRKNLQPGRPSARIRGGKLGDTPAPDEGVYRRYRRQRVYPDPSRRNFRRLRHSQYHDDGCF